VSGAVAAVTGDPRLDLGDGLFLCEGVGFEGDLESHGGDVDDAKDAGFVGE